MPDTTQNTGLVDELQQAIDSIAADAQNTAPVMGVNDMPLPPQPEVQNATEVISNDDQITTGMVIPEAPVPEEVAKIGTELETEKVDTNFADLKKQALGELKTLAEKVDLSAEDKFDIYKEVITETNDKSCLQQAYAAAQGIADETEKVKALLFVVDTIKKSE